MLYGQGTVGARSYSTGDKQVKEHHSYHQVCGDLMTDDESGDRCGLTGTAATRMKGKCLSCYTIIHVMNATRAASPDSTQYIRDKSPAQV